MKQLLKKLRWKWHRDITTLMNEQASLFEKVINEERTALLAKMDEERAELLEKVENLLRSEVGIPNGGKMAPLSPKVSAVLSLLQDEESRELFFARLEYSQKGTLAPLYRCLMESDRTGDPVDIISFLRDRLNAGETSEELVVYGRTWLTKELFIAVKDLGVRIDFICEAESPDWLRTEEDAIEYNWMGIPVIAEDELLRSHKSAQIITGFIEHQGVVDYLIKKGIPASHIWGRHTQWEPQYLAPDIIHPHKHEIYVDGGALDLQNTVEFIDWCHGEYSSVYAFKPDLNNYRACLNRIKNDPALDPSRIHLFHAALWHEDTILNFEDGYSGASNINDYGSSAVQARSIDSILQGAPVTFIKLDIEGVEMDSLVGAKESIIKWKPRLAICIYHKPEDPIEIPLYIQNLVPEYKMYIRHYSTCSAETVLYCVCDDR